jgi:ribonuclease VapC
LIVVDSSALIAILEKESDTAIYATAIRQADRVLISAVNVHEAGTVLRARHGMAAAKRMWRFLKDENDFEIVPFDESQARAATGGTCRRIWM